MEQLCGKGKKPTSRSAPYLLLAEAQEVLKLIVLKENAGAHGDDFDSEDDFSEE